ncbi:thiolase family protein [Sinimarinibacterium sp. CAU 1509]|uniref:thiolase family protein n=1 Tax=Sinimarinibacterium sp. CAU 1509 TaxID=2562283 RepID=UPI0010ACFCAC|nr:thiolase family protein [Sinimarinibacterium sp. CAU 1509]TJY55922.1 thiolase family protein [Sinimarinibacterium sp. CAU 1509]
MIDAVIAGYVRTPFHFARKGRLVGVRPDDLAAIAIRALVDRADIDPALIEDVLLGCAYPEAEQGSNIARLATLLAGLPQSVGGATMNRFCGSSMTAIHTAAGQIALGAGEAFICGGVESMTRVPQGGFNHSPNPRFRTRDGGDAEIMTEAYIPMGETAENVAERYQVARADQEQLAFESQQKAAAAQASGKLKDEIVAVPTADGLVDVDGCLRPQTTLDGLAALKPAFRPDGTVTAGTASPLTDGASAVLVCSSAFAARHRLPVLARIKSLAVAGCEPEIMGIGPAPATRKALARAGLTIDDIDIVEINEAFGSQAVACLRELEIPRHKVNLDGGAIAIGHPLGATGARITGKAAQLLKREGKRYALATQCIGGGQGVATILEAV